MLGECLLGETEVVPAVIFVFYIKLHLSDVNGSGHNPVHDLAVSSTWRVDVCEKTIIFSYEMAQAVRDHDIFIDAYMTAQCSWFCFYVMN